MKKLIRNFVTLLLDTDIDIDTSKHARMLHKEKKNYINKTGEKESYKFCLLLKLLFLFQIIRRLVFQDK